MNAASPDDELLPPGMAERLDPVCERFESDWRAGGRPRLEDFLPRVEEPDRPALVRELLAVDLHWRVRHGERPTEEEYRLRLPQYAALIEHAFRLATTADAAPVLPPPVGPGTTLTSEGAVPVLPNVPGYEVLAEIGRGGMGVVYQARQQGTERLAALKVLRSGEHAGPDELARFRVEATALGRLNHPHVVQVYEVGTHGGLPFFSLEYMAGGSLADRLDGTPWDPRNAALLLETLARAVHAAHQCGIIHRDLKPGNVLLDAAGAPKVGDFGLAKNLSATEKLSQTGAVMGTPSYMPPEQVRGRAEEIGPAADVYALGAILYELLTGRPPFLGRTSLETLRQVLDDEPVPPRRLVTVP